MTEIDGQLPLTPQARADLNPQFSFGDAGALPAGKLAASEGQANTPPLQIIVGAGKPQELYAYIRGLSPDDLSLQLEAFDRGMLRTVIPMWRKMARRDGHLLSVSEKRLGRLAAMDWEVNPVDSSPEAKRQAEFLGAFLEAIPDFDTRLEELGEAIMFSIAGHEIEWLPNGGPGGELRCKLWKQNPEDLDLTVGRPRLWVRNASCIELPPDKFVIHRLKVGLMEPSSILYVMKMITAGQWLAFGEKFGMPGIIGNAPASASQADVEKFYQMLCNWAQEFVAVNREGYTVTTLPAAGANGTLTYPQLVEWADKENSKIWTGHTVTTDGQSGSGTLAGEGAQDQLDSLVTADAGRLSATIERALCEPAVRFQFGQPLLAHFRLKTEKPISPADKAVEATTDNTLINDLGMKIPLADLYAKYGYRMPEGDEPVASGRPQPAAFNPLRDPAGNSPGNPIAFKSVATPDQVDAARKEMSGMLAPLQQLVDRAGEMTEAEFKAAVLKLQLPVEGLAGEMQKLLIDAYQSGGRETLAKAQASLQRGGH
jgi:phage gp29-like protein